MKAVHPAAKGGKQFKLKIRREAKVVLTQGLENPA